MLAPLLILGGALGCLAGLALPGDPVFQSLLGMAAMLAVSLRASLTATVFAVEIAGNLGGLPAPLAAATYAVAVLLFKHSIVKKITRCGRPGRRPNDRGDPARAWHGLPGAARTSGSAPRR